AERAADLMQQLAGASISGGLVDSYPAPLPSQVVNLNLREVQRLLGMELPAAEVVRILRALDYEVEEAGPETLTVTAPPNRVDIQVGAADLIEDLARIYGYDR